MKRVSNWYGGSGVDCPSNVTVRAIIQPTIGGLGLRSCLPSGCVVLILYKQLPDSFLLLICSSIAW